MTLPTRKLTALLISSVLLLLSACSPLSDSHGNEASSQNYEIYNQHNSVSEENSVQAAFDAFTNQLFIKNVQGSTLDLHYLLADPSAYGITNPPVTLGDVSSNHFKDYYTGLHDLLETLNTYDYNKLSPSQQLTCDVMKDYINTELMAENHYYHTVLLSPTIGTQSQLPILLAEYAFYSEQDVKDYLTLIPQVSDYFSSILDFEAEKSRAGCFMSDRAVDDIIKSCEDFIAASEENYLIEIFDEKINKLEGIDETLKAQYKEQNREVILNDLIPAYNGLIDGLSNLKGTGTNENGLWGYGEDGKDYYEYLVRSATGSSRTIEELISLIEKRMDSQIRTIAVYLNKYPDLLEDWDNFSFSLTDPEQILEQLKQKITDDYPALPETNYELKYVHKALEDSLSPAFYLTPPIDRLTDNVIYINNGNTSPEYLYSTLAHEGYPGHLFQTVYYSSVCDTPIRHLYNYPGYSEGWATYVEYESYAYDDSDNPMLNQLIKLNSSITLAIYALLDININYNEWDLEDAAAFINKYFTGISQPVIEEIYYTMIEEPSNYLSYYVGYLEISLLREEAEEALGDNFNLKEFHTFFLNMGDCSYDVIHKYMKEWINSQPS